MTDFVVLNSVLSNDFGVSEDTILCKSNIPHKLITDCDAIIFNAFIVPDKIDLDTITRFQIIIGGLKMFDIPWDIIKMNNVRHIDKFFYVTILSECFGTKFDEKLLIPNKFMLPLSTLKQECWCVLKTNDSDFEYEIMTDKIFYDKKIMDNIENSTITHIINEYEQCDITKHTTYIGSCRFIEGFYVKTLVPLSDYKLTSMCDRGYDVIVEHKNKNTIAYYENLQEISKSGYIYWFKLNKYTSKNNISNFLRHIKIILCPYEIDSGCIYILKTNELMFDNGLCYPKYSN